MKRGKGNLLVYMAQIKIYTQNKIYDKFNQKRITEVYN